MIEFSHLHCHTEYSLLDGVSKIKDIIKKAKDLNMKSLAITDHGNMFGVPSFVFNAQKEKIKPIIGCEFYLADNMYDRKNKVMYHQVLLAKNIVGYNNLSRLCSLGYLEGFYYKPRIDKELIKKHSEGVIATTCCISGEIPRAILNKGRGEAESLLLEWLNIFGSDYYIELQRHEIQEQDICNEVLIQWSRKYNIKLIATNDVHYTEKKDSEAQDVLLSIQTGKLLSDEKRMRFKTNHFYLKSQEEMLFLFRDIPESVYNTQEIADKVENVILEKDILLPFVALPKKFQSISQYLRHLVLSGARLRYSSLTDQILTRINYELGVIEDTRFPGYFLIIYDLMEAAKRLDVLVGPGRGSVGGSMIAYCLGITTIDPIRYNLFFERFLNPARVSLPDIDIDFDDIGRQRIIDYVIEQYGKKQVAQIITFGSMAAKSAIRDVGRVLELSLERTNYIAKLVPEKPNINLIDAIKSTSKLFELTKKVSLEARVINFAKVLEGAIRHTGIHAAGVIITTKGLLMRHVPIKIDKNSDLFVTQYDGSLVEKVGVLKMDFLGLKTLSIIKETLKLIHKNYDIYLDLNSISLKDHKTFLLYQKGETTATFQFESDGMKQWLKKLCPNIISDLIAMNALYRPGPMQFIPDFVNSKIGKKIVDYPHPILEPVLKSTYGIMIYQEQIMKIAQLVAGYNLGEADLLRRVMSKKNTKTMNYQSRVFSIRAIKESKISKSEAMVVFYAMARFAEYGFPLAHSTVYTMIAYQTAYLKANYPAEYMASVLTNNLNDIDRISFFVNECKLQNVGILGPSVNESNFAFNANTNKQIRFGLGGIKGVGTLATEEIIKSREQYGFFDNIFTFSEIINLNIVNKKVFESLAMSGAFDCLKEHHRRQYIYLNKKDDIGLIEKVIKYGTKVKKQKSSLQKTLFLDNEGFLFEKPKAFNCTPYTLLEISQVEKDMVGFYISAHPLSQFSFEIENFCNCDINNIVNFKNKEIFLAAVIDEVFIRKNRYGGEFAFLNIEDYQGKLNLALFGKIYENSKNILEKGGFVYVKGMVLKNKQDENLWELRPERVSLLSNIKTDLSKDLNFNIFFRLIDNFFIEKIKRIMIKYTGKCTIAFFLIDKNQNIKLKIPLKNYTINPTNNFLSSMMQIGCIDYKLS